MKVQRPVVLAAVAALVALLAWQWLGEGGGAGLPLVSRRAATPRSARSQVPVPRIGLARLDAEPSPMTAGKRDLFAFGPPPPSSTPPTTMAAAKPAPKPVATPAPRPSGPPPPPPLKLRFIGAVEREPGLKVAVLMTERREILTGQVGQLVANRMRVVTIGLESVDLEDVLSKRVSRIPLKGE